MVKRTITITTILLIISIAISLIIVLNKSSFAADDIASGTSGTCSWVIDSEGVLTISPTDGVSGVLDSYSASYNRLPWNDYLENITKVVVNNGVKANEDSKFLFYGLQKCSEMDLSNFDTSNVKNMSCMFEKCTNLGTLDLSNFITDNVTNMSGLFRNCYNLTDLDISNFNTSNVTTMASMFLGCTKITELNLSHFDTSKVVYMTSMFYDCNILSTLNISSFNTENVQDMGQMFRSCFNLKNLDVSNFNTSKVKNMDYMFDNCQKVTSLDVSGFDTSNVVSMKNMFCGCELITKLDLSNFNTSKVTNMNLMFASCQNMSSLNVLSFDTSRVTSMTLMFYWCPRLKFLDLSSFDTRNATVMKDMFKINPSSPGSFSSIKLGKNFSFKGSNIYTKDRAIFMNPPTSSPYTGKWIREDGEYGPYTSEELRDNYDGSTMSGIWLWEKTAPRYTVSYSFTGYIPSGASELPQSISYLAGETVHVADWATAPGYTFSGWSRNDFIMPEGRVEITGYFIPNEDTAYKVEHYLEDETLGTYTLKETENLTGTTDTTKRATPKTYAGYTFDSTIEGTVRRGTILGDGSLVLKLYYRRNEVPVENGHRYKVQYFFDGILDDSLEEIINAEVDSEVNITPTTPIKHGEKNYTLVSNNHKITISVNDEDNVIRVYYETDVLDYAIDGDATEGDGIPDKYQIRITYKVENGNWNDGSKGTKTDIVTLKDKDGNLSEDGTGTTTIPEVGSKPNNGYTKGYWNKVIPNKVSSKDDGKEFVYSYESIDKVKSDISGGKGKSSNPKTDDVMNKYLLVGIGGISVLALVSKIRRKYSRKAKKIQY